MIKSYLSNLRWICLPSENLGEDWFEKSLAIDQLIEVEGMDLAEEAVYLLFSSRPNEVLEGKGDCLIARSVIGPKKALLNPYLLIDWKASAVWRESLVGENLRQILESAEILRSQTPVIHQAFILCVRRELNPNLSVKVEVMFHE